MLKFALMLCALLAMPVMANGQFSRLDELKDGSAAYNTGMVVDLPMGESKISVTLAVADDYQSDRRQAQVLQWFNADPRLMKLRNDSHFSCYYASNPLFRDRYAKYVGSTFPIVTIQSHDGRVLFNCTGVSMPQTSKELADMIYRSLNVSYAPPVFAGQDNSTPIMRAGDCGPDGCGPRPTPFSTPPVIQEVIPSPLGSQIVPIAIFLALLSICGLVFYHLVRLRGQGSPSKLY